MDFVPVMTMVGSTEVMVGNLGDGRTILAMVMEGSSMAMANSLRIGKMAMVIILADLTLVRIRLMDGIAEGIIVGVLIHGAHQADLRWVEVIKMEVALLAALPVRGAHPINR